ncbi:hypothetical protein [Microbacterium sp. ZW T5_56]|uniref:hypothetical protein n=1 Tax=Microbacterium sp. ZW T5_56 TaxID=3378081 RepID=UPI0038522362
MGWRFRNKKTAEPAPPAAPADLVVPMLSGQSWKDATAAKLAQIPDFPAGQHPFAQPLTGEVYVTYAIDPGPSWEIVNIDEVPAYGDAASLHERALSNLARRGDIEVEGGSGRYRLTVPDEMDLTASTLLAPARWRAAVDIPGDLAVAVPTRIHVLLCSADDTETVAALQGYATELFAQAASKPVTTQLLRLDAAGTLSVLR